MTGNPSLTNYSLLVMLLKFLAVKQRVRTSKRLTYFLAYEQSVLRSMFFLKKEEIKICGTTYPISNACQVDSYNCKMHLITAVCFQTGPDTVNSLDQDNYAAWKKEAIKALKDWDKMYVKH
jgi:hypothetical protein